MLTVVEGLDSSGTSRTRRPLLRRYSVMPSIEAASVTPAGRLAAPAWKARKDENSSAPRGRGSFDMDRRMADYSFGMAESVGVYTV